MINIESKLLSVLESSTCFGIAHDETAPECKQCDVRAQCKAKCEGAAIPTPKTKPAKEVHKSPDKTPVSTKPASSKPSASAKPASTPKPASEAKSTTKKPENKPKPTPTPSSGGNGDMPDFKSMSLEDLAGLAKKRGIEWKDYGNDNITRMRLIMSLKKSYQ